MHKNWRAWKHTYQSISQLTYNSGRDEPNLRMRGDEVVQHKRSISQQWQGFDLHGGLVSTENGACGETVHGGPWSNAISRTLARRKSKLHNIQPLQCSDGSEHHKGTYPSPSLHSDVCSLGTTNKSLLDCRVSWVRIPPRATLELMAFLS